MSVQRPRSKHVQINRLALSWDDQLTQPGIKTVTIPKRESVRDASNMPAQAAESVVTLPPRRLESLIRKDKTMLMHGVVAFSQLQPSSESIDADLTEQLQSTVKQPTHDAHSNKHGNVVTSQFIARRRLADKKGSLKPTVLKHRQLVPASIRPQRSIDGTCIGIQSLLPPKTQRHSTTFNQFDLPRKQRNEESESRTNLRKTYIRQYVPITQCARLFSPTDDNSRSNESRNYSNRGWTAHPAALVSQPSPEPMGGW